MDRPLPVLQCEQLAAQGETTVVTGRRTVPLAHCCRVGTAADSEPQPELPPDVRPPHPRSKPIAIDADSSGDAKTLASPVESLAPLYEVLPPERREHDIFITHAQASGQDQCKTLCLLLQARGFSVWYDMQDTDLTKERMQPSTFIKFLYGHLLESVAILLIKLSGHTVTDMQKEVEVDGIKGHMDCKIDGEVVDIKTASNFSFKKFSSGALVDDDPFGYMAQLAGYEEAEGRGSRLLRYQQRDRRNLLVQAGTVIQAEH